MSQKITARITRIPGNTNWPQQRVMIVPGVEIFTPWRSRKKCVYHRPPEGNPVHQYQSAADPSHPYRVAAVQCYLESNFDLSPYTWGRGGRKERKTNKTARSWWRCQPKYIKQYSKCKNFLQNLFLMGLKVHIRKLRGIGTQKTTKMRLKRKNLNLTTWRFPLYCKKTLAEWERGNEKTT